MRRLAPRLLLSLLALSVAACGMAGAAGYVRDYSQHRGFSRVRPLPRARAGELRQINFYSRALKGPADYLVYLPPGYTTARRYPVYYLLHGTPGKPQGFIDIANLDVRLDNQIALGAVRPMILVFPDGRIDGRLTSDAEWANTPSGDYENEVIDVVVDVDHRFSTLAERGDRVIAGLSEGGYGAMNIALHHLGTFGAVQSWSGYFLETHNGVFARASRAVMRYNSPLLEVRSVASQIRALGLHAYLFIGRDDANLKEQAPMVAALRAAGAQVGSAVYPGGHDWGVWAPRLDAMLRLASRDMNSAPRPLTASAQPVGPAARTDRGAVAGAPPASSPSGAVPAARVPRRRHRRLELIAALLLALFSSAMINLGFVLQHRGLQQTEDDAWWSGVARNRAWLTGQCIGTAGFGALIVALAIAPLTLVQVFAAGSFAVATPLAARAFGVRVTRRGLCAIAVTAAGLATLALGTAHHGHGHLHPGTLLIAAILGAALAAQLARGRQPSTGACAAGLAYGIADAAIKAELIRLHHHGLSGLLSPWTAVALAASFGGFLCFQSALRRGAAVAAVALMNIANAVVAVALGLIAFGESLGAGPVTVTMHLAAIACVLACVPTLVGLQRVVAGVTPSGPGVQSGDPAPERGPDGTGVARLASAVRVRAVLSAAWMVLSVVIAVVVGTGLLYELRQLRWLPGPRIVPDALPLLQLAGYAAQPLPRVLLAWLAAGFVLATAVRVSTPRSALLTAVGGLGLVLLLSDACAALAHDLRFSAVLASRMPSAGSYLEAGLLIAPCLVAAVGPWRAAGRVCPQPVRRAATARRSHVAVASERGGRAFRVGPASHPHLTDGPRLPASPPQRRRAQP